MHPTKIAAEEVIGGVRIESNIGEETSFTWYELRVMNIEKGMGGM